MIVSKKEITKLSEDIRKIIDGQSVDILDNKEGKMSILRNDIHTLSRRLIEQADISEKQNQTLRQTIADISHQLKTPLTSMLIMTDLLENSTPEKQSEFILNIKNSLSRMEWLITSLLKLAKLQSGTSEFNLEKTSSAEIISSAVKSLEIILDIKNQKIVVEENDITIFCDKRWTVEALTNILKNASENSPEESVISVKTGINPITSWISVKDCGKGIPKTEIPGIFTRFQGSRNQHGYGIGLPLSMAIMRNQNGDIEVESSENNGSVFTLKFY